jgi:methylenetetrahydrofolate dehydrogenase (NADP+)/methenyltetrahydrofolate cyclohydrolase
MTAQRLEGKPLVQELRARTRAEVASIVAERGHAPTLAVVLVAGNPAADQYARRIRKNCDDVGLGFRLVDLPADVAQPELNAAIAALSADDAVHGVLIQMPLPLGLSAEGAVLQLDYRKDVDGLHPFNAGLLAQGAPHLVPNTPAGGMELLRYYNVDLVGKRAVMVGRSNVVGRPMAFMLLYADATVTVCHHLTPDLGDVLREHEIVVTATGVPGLIRGHMLRPGAVVVDFGTTVLPDGTTVGDADYASVSEVASALTPVPGGTGPVTNIMLLRNVLRAYHEIVR